MTPLAGACERTSDVALTFRWLLALGLRLLGRLLFQLPTPLSLKHWVFILGLPVDMTVDQRGEKGEKRNVRGVDLEVEKKKKRKFSRYTEQSRGMERRKEDEEKHRKYSQVGTNKEGTGETRQ